MNVATSYLVAMNVAFKKKWQNKPFVFFKNKLGLGFKNRPRFVTVIFVEEKDAEVYFWIKFWEQVQTDVWLE